MTCHLVKMAASGSVFGPRARAGSKALTTVYDAEGREREVSMKTL